MRKKFVSIFVILFVPVLFSLNSCDPYDCGDSGGTFFIEDLELTLAKLISGNEEANNYVEVEVNSVVNYDQIRLLIHPLSTRRALNNNRDYVGLSAAVACSPVFKYDDIESIEILSTAYADEIDISSIFSVVAEGDYFFSGSLSDYLASNPSFPARLILYPTEPPKEAGIYSFEVNISLSGGALVNSVLTTEAAEITISESN